MAELLILEKFSFGVGDRFAHQAKAQLRAFMLAAQQGVDVTPVWNKSNREHVIVGSEPASTRATVEAAVKELRWQKAYHVDADHIQLGTVDRFIPHSDFYTIDVADWIGKPAEAKAVETFLELHPELVGQISIPRIEWPFQTTLAEVKRVAGKYLLAVQEAGKIYRHIAQTKGERKFITEVSMDETDSPQTPPELLIILAAIADEKIPIQTIALKFTGRFNKGVDYVGDIAQFEKEFNEDLAVISFAVNQYGLPATLKLSVHSGSDKFSIYAPMRRALARFGSGLHIKTAGTNWLEEVIGLAEAGGDGLSLAKEIYAGALAHAQELCAPYATVIDIDSQKLPSATTVNGWNAKQFTSALRHDQSNPAFNPHLRQLIHVGYKIAAKMGNRYLDALEKHEDSVAKNVTANLYERHMKPLFVGLSKVASREAARTGAGGNGIVAMKFIHEDFLLQTRTARRLYHQFAKTEPILDFHCHLSPKDIAENRQFKNLFEIWLEGDHYKWRAMRSNGVAERFCTGDADPFAKFQAWAATVPHTLRNPLYHWTHLELRRYFGIDELLDEASAVGIWKEANEQLATPELTTQGILKKFNVKTLCTTDDPTDDLSHHKAILASDLTTRVLPAFRPDKALAVHQPEQFNPWVSRLAEASGIEIDSFVEFLDALRSRHDYFHAQGCRISDHGLTQCYSDFCPEKTAAAIFASVQKGRPATLEEQAQFSAFMMLIFGQLDAAKGWTKQLHLGALRNNNSRQLAQLGPDTGFDSIGDFPQAGALAAYLDRLDQEKALSKTIIYNNNPADNYVFATMLGNFQDGTMAGKIQLGSGWWFLDQKEGIEWQLNALSNLGLLSRFVGMVTDSRSFMSYPRHEYFRRVLCNLVGRDVENGEIPDDDSLLGPMIQNICYANAQQYLQLPTNESNAAR